MSKFSPEVQDMIDRVMNYEDAPPKPAPTPKNRKRTPVSGPGRGAHNKGVKHWGGGIPRIDREMVKNLHLEGKTNVEIAKVVGCRSDSISRILKEVVPDYVPRKGRIRAEKCQRGHSEWKELKNGRGRYCAVCERDRNRESHRKRSGYYERYPNES